MSCVRIYYIKHSGEDDLAKIDEARIDQWLHDLSVSKRSSILRLKKNRDQRTSLLGLCLLKKCAIDEDIKNFTLSDIRYPDSGKPYWHHSGDQALDFNISHSGSMIMVAASKNTSVGIDVEKIRELKRLSFKMVMRSEELERINSDPDIFFDLWSKKEAVVKAADTAGISKMRDVIIENSAAVLDGDRWFLTTIDLHEEYVINLATSSAIDNVSIEQVDIKNLQ